MLNQAAQIFCVYVLVSSIYKQVERLQKLKADSFFPPDFWLSWDLFPTPSTVGSLDHYKFPARCWKDQIFFLSWWLEIGTQPDRDTLSHGAGKPWWLPRQRNTIQCTCICWQGNWHVRKKKQKWEAVPSQGKPALTGGSLQCLAGPLREPAALFRLVVSAQPSTVPIIPLARVTHNIFLFLKTTMHIR